MRHVILGNGPAGVIAAETLRKHARHDEITLIGEEPEPPYSRMAIPYLLSGAILEGGTYLRKGKDHFADRQITLHSGRAQSVDCARREVLLADGTVRSYDRLLIATGSSPVRPSVQGMELAGVHACWTLADARRIMEIAKPGAKVVQMGAGFIGCIIMEALASRGVALNVVETGDRMVPRMMGEGAGGMIKRWVEGKGVKVYTSCSVGEIRRNGNALDVRLSNGMGVDADLVISAVGVRPNIGFLQSSGILCAHGVLADQYLQTNVPGVFAAGDCAEALDQSSGKHIVSAIQPNAAEQAYCAAMNMVGKTSALRGVTQINVLDTLGLVSASFGAWQGVAGGEHAELKDELNYRLLRLEFADDVLVGANCIGLTDHVGVLRGLIESRVKLGAWKDRLMQNPLALMEAYLATALAQAAWGFKAG